MGWKARERGEDATKLKDVVGKQFTIVDFQKKHSAKFNSDFVLIDAVDSDGNEVTLMGGGHLYDFLNDNRDELPDDCVVVSFDTNFGNKGYGLEPVGGYAE